MTAKHVLRDLPGVAELEARLARIEAHPNPLWAPEVDGLDEAVDRLIERLFGVTWDDLNDPDADPATPRAIKLIETNDWAAEGWDVSDGQGRELRALTHLGIPLVCAICGLAGTLPSASNDRSLSEREAKDIEARLRDEAAKFRPKR